MQTIYLELLGGVILNRPQKSTTVQRKMKAKTVLEFMSSEEYYTHANQEKIWKPSKEILNSIIYFFVCLSLDRCGLTGLFFCTLHILKLIWTLLFHITLTFPSNTSYNKSGPEVPFPSHSSRELVCSEPSRYEEMRHKNVLTFFVDLTQR